MRGMWRKALARRLDPATHDAADRGQRLYALVSTLHRWCGEFPDIDAACGWVFGCFNAYYRKIGEPADPRACNIDTFRELLRRSHRESGGAQTISLDDALAAVASWPEDMDRFGLHRIAIALRDALLAEREAHNSRVAELLAANNREVERRREAERILGENGVIPPELRDGGASYVTPEHGWTCFHCGETFTHHIPARRHFGANPSGKPACQLNSEDRGLLIALRAAERDLAEAKASERARIAARVREMCILRLQADADPLEEVNSMLQQLADDIKTDWADYSDGDDA